MLSGLESAKLKLIRAAEHIESVRKTIRDYLAEEPSGITKQPNGKYQLNFAVPSPPSISVFAGEALYQMRSALDHLAFDLVKMNPTGIQLPASWEKRCEFPLLVDVPTKGNPPIPYDLPLPYNFFEKSLPGISKAAFAVIEALQPYNSGDGCFEMRVLAALSNIDKHRHLHVTKGQAQVRLDVSIGGGHHVWAGTPVEDGAEVQIPFPKGVKMAGGFQPFVTFDESTLGQHATGLTADHLLQFCLEGVERFVIPAFDKLIHDP